MLISRRLLDLWKKQQVTDPAGTPVSVKVRATKGLPLAVATAVDGTVRRRELAGE